MLAALYARVSTSRQAEKDLSIPDQLRQMREWCAARGHQVVIEYVEPGMTATDDRRPEFQKMIGEATTKPRPYDLIVVYTQSRFFRDAVEFGLYERKLLKAGVKLVSISQEVGDDPAGGLMRRIFSVFDEYQSNENGKNTLRSMKENARQGYFNGSKPPFGYRVVEVEAPGRHGNKKRLEIDPAESRVVKRIFSLYVDGRHGHDLGAKQIAEALNVEGLTYRGVRWNRSLVHKVLANRAYIGEYYFNTCNNKTKQAKPEAEWVRIELPSIIDPEVFGVAAGKRSSRAPEKVAPAVAGSTHLLTGLLKCGCCGAGLTTATGKGGRYRYYKCHTRLSRSVKACDNPPVPMDKLDDLVLGAIADHLLAPERLMALFSSLQERLSQLQAAATHEIDAIKAELEEVQTATQRLYEAVEKGFLPIDATLQERTQKLQARRQALMLKLGRCQKPSGAQLDPLDPNAVSVFGEALRRKLRDRSSGFGRRYVRLLVNEVRVKGKCAEISGSKAALLQALRANEKGTLGKGALFCHSWLPDLGSNQGPTD